MEIKNPTTMVRYDIGEAKTLDPADAYDTGSSEPIFQIYDTLVTYKGNDTKTFYPCLATEWSVSDDSLTWTFKLRQNVKFSNGNDFTAEDLTYFFDRVLIMDAPESGVSWILGQCMDTNSTTVIDDYTVQIKLTDPYGGFLSLLPYTIGSDPAWSPDGQPHCFTSLRDGRPLLYVLNLKDKSVLRLIEPTEWILKPPVNPPGRRWGPRSPLLCVEAPLIRYGA